MDAFFKKYSVSLDERNAVEHIAHTAKAVKKGYSKDDDGYLKDLAELHEMIEDFFEAKELRIEDYEV